jgi:predicted O-methyltransferase YrrM
MKDLSALDDLDGLIDADIGRALYDLAVEIPADQAIVEIGSYRGMSTCYLATGARDGHGPKVYAVDPWDPAENAWCPWCEQATFAEWEAQLKAKRLRSRVIAVQALSVDAAEGYRGKPIGLLFVDGNHAREAVLADFAAWHPHLAPDAVVVFDDYLVTKNPGVGEAVTELRQGPLAPEMAIAAGRMAVCTLRPESS